MMCYVGEKKVVTTKNNVKFELHGILSISYRPYSDMVLVQYQGTHMPVRHMWVGMRNHTPPWPHMTS